MKHVKISFVFLLLFVSSAKANLVELKYEFDTVRHAVAYYDREKSHIDFSVVSDNLHSKGTVDVSFQTDFNYNDSFSTSNSNNLYYDSAYYSSFYQSNFSHVSINSSWKNYFESFEVENKNRDVTITSINAFNGYLYPKNPDIKSRRHTSVNMQTGRHVSTDYSYIGDVDSGNYTEKLTSYSYSNSISLDELIRNPIEFPQYMSVSDILNIFQTKDLRFNSYFHYEEIYTKYVGNEYDSQHLENFSSEQYFGTLRLVQVTEPSMILLLLFLCVFFLVKKYRNLFS